MKRKLLVIDTETGGFDPNVHAICSLAAVVVNQGSVEDSFYVLIKDPTGEIDMERTENKRPAFEVNGLNEDVLEEEGYTPLAAVSMLEAMLQRHDMRDRVMLAGHFVSFDIGFLKRLYRLAGANYENRFSHRALCTQTGALLLEQAGRIDLPGGSASLDNLARYFSVPLDRERGHNALNDAHATACVLQKMLEKIGAR